MGTPQFRCDPIVSQALRRRVERNESRPAYRPPRKYELNVQSYTAATGATRRTYRYSDGRERHGEILELPGGAVRIRETDR